MELDFNFDDMDDAAEWDYSCRQMIEAEAQWIDNGCRSNSGFSMDDAREAAVEFEMAAYR